MPQGDSEGETAIDWAIQLRDPTFAAWERFTVWLEADPANAAAYDAVALADREAGDLPPPVRLAPAANDDDPTPRRSRMKTLGGVVVTGLAAAIGWAVLVPVDTTYLVETAPGTHRELTLSDGSRVQLNGGTRLALDRTEPRHVRIDAGEAVFTVRHDAAHPFVVTAGDTILQDVGTIFNVERSAGSTSVAVAEGGVMLNPASDRLLVGAGRMIRVADRSSHVEAAAIDPGAVGSWRTGRLVYRDASLARVAADLSRSIGTPVTLTPDLADRTFSGVIVVDADRQQLFRRVGGLLDATATRDGPGWRLTSRTRAAR